MGGSQHMAVHTAIVIDNQGCGSWGCKTLPHSDFFTRLVFKAIE